MADVNISASQSELFRATQPPYRAPKENLRAVAHEWMRAHPVALSLLRKYAGELVAAGVGRFGVALLWERLRYDTVIDRGLVNGGGDGGGVKLPNNHRAYVAREMVRLWPELDGKLTLREVSH